MPYALQMPKMLEAVLRHKMQLHLPEYQILWGDLCR
jgi:hypothetical protein